MHEDSIEFSLSSTDKGAVGFIPAQELAILTLPTHGIAPRPLFSSELHGTNNNNIPDTNNNTSTTTENLNNDLDDLPLALIKP